MINLLPLAGPRSGDLVAFQEIAEMLLTVHVFWPDFGLLRARDYSEREVNGTLRYDGVLELLVVRYPKAHSIFM
jgi:hypothetical protein